MAYYLLNSAVITAPGVYSYRRITPEKARAWYYEAAGHSNVVSAIGYQETVDLAGEILQVPIELNRQTIQMEAGDEALVVRLVLPPGAPRIVPGDKGALGRAVMDEHVEVGLLRREL